jgi:hypothetical protein
MQRLVAWLEDRSTPGLLLVTGWAAYITVVTASNLSELLWSFGWVDWSFRSGNLGYIHDATEIYFDSRAVNQLLLAGAMLWEATAAVLLWRAAALWLKRAPRVRSAAAAGLLVLSALWFAFAIGTEAFVAYDRGIDESAYWVLAAATLASLLVTVWSARSDESAT